MFTPQVVGSVFAYGPLPAAGAELDPADALRPGVAVQVAVGAVQHDGGAAVGIAHLADGAVSTVGIANLAVIEAKLADVSVSTRALQNGAVVSAKLGTGSVQVLWGVRVAEMRLDAAELSFHACDIFGIAA